MSRTVQIVFTCSVLLLAALLPVSAAIAQEDFTPGSEDTLKWVEPSDGFTTMLEDCSCGFLYFYSASKADFCKTVEKETIPEKSLARTFKKYVCMKVSSDAESQYLTRFEVGQGEVAVLFLDSQGKVVEKITEQPDKKAFAAAIRKTDKANKEIKKFIASLEKLYKQGLGYFSKGQFHKATLCLRNIEKARETYVEKKGDIESPYFEKAAKKLVEIREEATKLLIKANAAIQKDDFGTGSTVLSKLRREFSLYPDVIKKVEQAETDLQRRMQRAQQGQ